MNQITMELPQIHAAFDRDTVPTDRTAGRSAAVPTPPAVDELSALAWLSRRRRAIWRTRITVGAVVLAVAATATVLAVTITSDPTGTSPTAVTTNSHAAVVRPGPTIPVQVPTGPGADRTKPSTPAKLRVTSRSQSAVALAWADAIDDTGINGYVVFRNGTQVATAHGPAYTDIGLTPSTGYQYTVAAFDAAGNVSDRSAAVSAVTLATPDVAPPSVPTDLHSVGQSVNSIVLAWSASSDNIGVAGYEVYRDGSLIANTAEPGYTDAGLNPATPYTYRVRAFDASNNASADSDATTVSTMAAPDTTPPTVPSGVDANGTSTTTIDVSWAASSDNIGVTGYLIYRDGAQVANVTGTSFGDQGLTPGTPYLYQVRAADAAGNQSNLSLAATASTMAPPPPPEVTSVDLVATNTDCVITVDVTIVVSAPMDVTLTYTVAGQSDSRMLTFTAGDLSQIVSVATGVDGTVDGSASADAGAESDSEDWVACTPP